MKPFGIKYLISYHPAVYGLHEETAGTLYVVNELTGNVFWFDNDNMEWHKSIYSSKSILESLGSEYKEVESFDNGYVNTEDIWEGIGYTSLISTCTEEFKRNINNFQEEKQF